MGETDMHKVGKYILSCMVLGLTTVWTGCSNNVEDLGYTVKSDSIYISLQLNTPSTTRTDPKGGETGDGTEAGINNENKIHSLALFLYRDDAANSIESTVNPALTRISINGTNINQTSETSFTTFAVPASSITLNAGYHVVCIANALNTDIDNIATLSDLQNYTAKQAWTEATDIKDYDNFVMTSRYKTASDDLPFTLSSANKKNNPLLINITLERLASRIDIIPMTTTNGATYNSAKYYEYKVGTTGDVFRLTDIKAINCMKAGEYWLKHIAKAESDNSISTGYNLIGTELPESGIETNYVLDPWTRNKTAAATTLDVDGTATAISDMYRNYISSAAVNSWATRDAVPQCTSDAHYILDYTMENTMPYDCQTTKYSTGILLKGVYIPAVWYTLSGSTLTSGTPTAGTTFYRYNGKCYATASAVAFAVNTDEGTSLNDVTVLHHAGVQTFSDGTCYYDYWIRHSNNNNELTSAIMEFATVRNNIYRITINSITAPGTPTPDPNTNRNDEGLMAIVHVIPWSVYLHSTIYM